MKRAEIKCKHCNADISALECPACGGAYPVADRLEQQPEVSCMYCEKTVEYSSGIFTCEECSGKHPECHPRNDESHHPQPISDERIDKVFKKFTDDFIEQDGFDGGLRDNELQMYWEGGTTIRSKIKAALTELGLNKD